MRYLVPQFLETEQKIFGPFNFTNFVVLIGVGGVAFMLYFLLNFIVWIIVAVLLGIGTLVLMFYQRDGRSLPAVLYDGARHFIGINKYVWEGSKQKENPVDVLVEPKLPAEEGEDIKAARQAKEIKQKAQEALKKMEELTKRLDQ